MRQQIQDHIKKEYGVSPEHPWKRYPDFAVFRHSDNGKWFALIMDVDTSKLGLPGGQTVDVIDLKVGDPLFRDVLIREDGILPAYHMNKTHWVTVLLDGTVPAERVFGLIGMSYLATASAKKQEGSR